MAIVELPGGGGFYDEATGNIVSYAGVPVDQVTPGMVAASPFYGGVQPNVTSGKIGGSLAISGGDVFYGDAVGGQGQALGFGLAFPGVIALSAVLGNIAKSGVGVLASGAIASLKVFAKPIVKGTKIAWGALPDPIKTAITFGGAVIGTDLLIDTGGDDTGLLTLPFLPGDDNGLTVPGGAGEAGLMHVGHLPAHVISSWVANGITFYRLEDGRLAVVNKRGKVKVWRPKKPIILFAGGAGNLRTFIRADKALDRQSKRLRKVLNRRAPVRRSSGEKHAGGAEIAVVKVETK